MFGRATIRLGIGPHSSWATVTIIFPLLSDGCLSCLTIILVYYCGQTVGWIRIPLGTEVGLDPGDIVRWGPSSLHGEELSSP